MLSNKKYNSLRSFLCVEKHIGCPQFSLTSKSLHMEVYIQQEKYTLNLVFHYIKNNLHENSYFCKNY